MSEPLWEAWIEAHHAVGCAERSKPVQDCRYRAAHIKTSKVFVDLLLAKGWRLVPTSNVPPTTPMFGDVPT